MKLSGFSALTAVCCLIIIGTFILGCSDDDKPTSPKQYGWAPLGTGMNDNVCALTVYNNHLFAGGDFTAAGGGNANYIAAWDGSAWSPIGTGTNAGVWALTPYQFPWAYELIVGGCFTYIGGAATNYLAGSNGSSWLHGWGGINNCVCAFTVYDNTLIIGGYFTTFVFEDRNYITAEDNGLD